MFINSLVWREKKGEGCWPRARVLSYYMILIWFFNLINSSSSSSSLNHSSCSSVGHAMQQGGIKASRTVVVLFSLVVFMTNNSGEGVWVCDSISSLLAWSLDLNFQHKFGGSGTY